MKKLVRAAIAALCVAVAPMVAAQPYPSKAIRFIVPNPPGGGTDVLSRLLASRMSELLQWQIVVENRPGAGGNIGLDAAAKAPPDGYTIAMGEASNLAINPSLYAKMPFDADKDLAPVALIGTVPLVLVVAPERGFDSLDAVVAAAKARSLTFASAGNGTVGHLVGEIWQRAAGVKLLHVPYKGAAQAMTDLAGGQVDIFFASLPAALPLIRGGKLRAVAVTSPQRAPLLADVPTVAESGLREFEATVWYGVVAPAGTPVPIVARLNSEINRVLQTPEVRSRYAADGVDLRGGTAAEFGTFVERERAKWSRAVRDSGAKVD